MVEIPSGAVAAGHLYQKAAAAYLSAVDHGKAALLVSPTWTEIEAVTTEVRAQLRQRGSLAAKEEKVRTFDSLGWTDAQKGLVSHYEPGSLVRFVKQTEHFKAGEIAEVVRVERKTIFLRGTEGKEIAFHPSRSPSSFDAGQKRELAVAAGDWLLLQANGGGFINGERVQVKETGPSGFALKDGRTLPAAYRTFTHGYAVTSHAAQGKTVDEVVVVASSRSFAAVSQESFYVGISRARERAQVFTDDAALLGERVLDRHTRKAALELQGLREELTKHGLLKIKTPVESVSARASVAVKNKEVPEEARREGRAFRVMRTLRQDVTQRLTQWSGELQRWVGERIGQTHPVAPRISRELTARQRLMGTLQRQNRSPDGPRQSRGHRI